MLSVLRGVDWYRVTAGAFVTGSRTTMWLTRQPEDGAQTGPDSDGNRVALCLLGLGPKCEVRT